MHFRFFAILCRCLVFIGIPYAIACGGNTIDFVGVTAGDSNAVSDGNIVQSGNVTSSPNVANSNSTNHTSPNQTVPAKMCPTLTTAVTYTNTTKALINDHCLSCHSSRSPKMTTYATAKTGFDTNGGLFDVQNGVMPPSSAGALDFNTVCLFEAWAKNNYAQ